MYKYEHVALGELFISDLQIYSKTTAFVLFCEYDDDDDYYY